MVRDEVDAHIGEGFVGRLDIQTQSLPDPNLAHIRRIACEWVCPAPIRIDHVCVELDLPQTGPSSFIHTVAVNGLPPGRPK